MHKMRQPPSKMVASFYTCIASLNALLNNLPVVFFGNSIKTQCFSALYISLNVTCSNALALLLRLLAKRRTLAQLLLSFHQEHRLQQLPLLIRAYIILLLLHEGIRYNRQLRRYLFTIHDIEVTFFIHFAKSPVYSQPSFNVALYLLVHYSILS